MSTNDQPGDPVTRPRFEPETSRTQSEMSLYKYGRS